ncbi:hypothetical protein Geob_3185 [Geotalea daltonii FRC-32]|uniref:Uncharacterized protein n=1 Tax=Geotalea daltonii (strain DSM 22248 / JCM 15807 / FRC-32) TaxID=316067 RepID=B9M473_GEODF|nr:hypothetical protein [Geotalea daltonii]ACM21528.1 hypothetical protein Geob_3185 [Geotalea daltonii FRC-32]
MITKPIAMKSFADFVSGTEATKLRVLRQYKYPNEEGLAMSRYYHPAKATIIEFNRDKRGIDWALDQAVELEKKALTPSKSLRNKLVLNSKAIRNYVQYFGAQHFNILKDQKFPFLLNEVKINVTPDIHTTHKGQDRYMKLYFGAKKPKYEFVRAILNCMAYGVSVNGGEIAGQSVVFVDVVRGNISPGVPLTDEIIEELTQHCADISNLWQAL